MTKQHQQTWQCKICRSRTRKYADKLKEMSNKLAQHQHRESNIKVNNIS